MSLTDNFKECYYDEKCCSRSLSILILYLAKMHHANYCGSISKTSLIFLTTISRLNCPPSPDYQSSCIERAGSREKVTSSTYEFNFSMCEPS